MTLKRTLSMLTVATLVLAVQSSCTRHEVDIKPVEIKPIHITVDVNVRIDKAVDDFFDDIYGDSNGKATK